MPFPPECTNIGTNDCEFGEFLTDYESEMVEKNIKYIYMYIRFNQNTSMIDLTSPVFYVDE